MSSRFAMADWSAPSRMRLLDYIGTAARDIATQPLRAALTISAVTLSSALLVTLVAIGITTRGAVVAHVSQGDALSTVIVSANSSVSSGFFSSSVQQTRDNAEKLTDDTVARLAALPGVASATPQVSIWELKSFQVEGFDASYVASAIATSQASLNRSQLAAGTWFNTNETSPNVVLGHGYLRALGVGDPAALVGKQLTFTTVAGYRGIGADIPSWTADRETRAGFDQTKTTLSARIVGVTKPSASDNRVYLPLGWGKQIQSPRTSTPSGETSVDMIDKNGYTTIALTTTSKEAVRGVAQAVEQLGFGAITYQRQIDQINQLSLVMWLILGAVALISLISASLGIANTLLMSVAEQKQAIQIWRASGASRGLISRLYILQSIMLSLVGACIGAGLGVVACRLINAKIEQVLSAQGMSSLQLPDVPLWIVGGGIILSVAIAVLAAIYPARRAARQITT